MILLASDTSTKSLSIAILQDGILLAGMTEQTGTTHCQTYMPAIQKLLEESGLRFSDIDLYACTVGPGSYTGIRIGVSTTKTMAYAGKKNAIGVSTLETLSIPHRSDTRMVCPILDARNRRVFSSGYCSDELVIPEANRTIEDLLDRISEILKGKPGIPGNERKNETTNGSENGSNNGSENGSEKGKPGMDLIFCGDIALAYQEDPVVKEKLKPLLDGHLLNQVFFLNSVPQAADAGVIAFRKFCTAGEGTNDGDPFALEANYLSPSQAERMKRSRAEASQSGS